ncbi:hypothetical protein [Marinobacter sp. C2H3]|uniref:hypothetical protein n=1 Tax=Marinobacter sp. C2H3 TaxID=3119003 RepID=UPI00300F07FD
MYQLVFRGECVAGTDQQTARNNARALFKATVEQVERMFSGQPVVIRNRLEQAQAEKYRAVLEKHGMIAYVQPMAGTAPEASGEPTPEPAPAPAAAPTPKPAARAPEAPAQRAAGAPSARPAVSVAVEPGERLAVAGERVDDILAGSGLTLDPVGVTLAPATVSEPPMFEHLDDWSLAPVGADLGHDREAPPVATPDISHLSLVDDADTPKR